jgi:thioredoxin-related protein
MLRMIYIANRMFLRLCAIKRIAALAAALFLLSAETRAAELVVLQQPGCAWCQRFEAEIGAAYPRTAQGRIAPLRRVDISKPWPEDLSNIRPERFTPTFLLIHEGQEVARLRGYAGDEFFWFLLDEVLTKLPPEPPEPGAG